MRRLIAARALEQQLEELAARPTPSLEPGARDRLLSLGQDLSRAWDSPGATVETKKKILRLVIAEIIVDVVGDTIALIIHWEGGDHTTS